MSAQSLVQEGERLLELVAHPDVAVQVFFNARRAAALALSGEPDEAARIGTSSAAVAHEVKSERTVRVLGDVLQSLDRWRGRPAVREFRESLTA
ncbi:hypothetical protein GCM10020227_68860 [Streptomyces flavovirens]